jgi:hypothetical protein
LSAPAKQVKERTWRRARITPFLWQEAPPAWETAADEFEEKLHKLIKRARKQRGMLWPSVISKLELARADVRSMIKVYDSGPK